MEFCGCLTVKVLLTGFEPYLTYTTNPSGELAIRFNGKEIAGADVVGRVLPVQHQVSASAAHEYIMTEKPDIVIATGIAASKGCVALENIAINRYLFKSKEEDIDEELYKDGKDVYMSTLPLEAIKGHLQAKGIPAEYSFTADTYISNEVFYEVMRSAEEMDIKKAGLIHIPLSHVQVVDMMHVHHVTRLGIPSMDMNTLENAIRIAITEAVKDQ